MGTKLTSGNNFHFPKEHGFSGSCGSHAVTGYMRGGHVKVGETAAPKKFPAGTPPKMTQQHKTTPNAYAKGGKADHKDYDDKNDTSDKPVYPEVGTVSKPEGYAKGGHHKHHKHHAEGGPEIEREELHEPSGTPSEPYEAAAKGGLIRRAKGGGSERASKISMKAERRETHHDGDGNKSEHQRHHEHGGKAKHRDGHTTPHPFAYGGAMPPAVMGAKHRAKSRGMGMGAPRIAPMGGGMNPMVSARAPTMAPPPVSPMTGGLKRGGRS
jgi:hypothetical protein